MSEVSIVFPHQLFEDSVFVKLGHPIYIVEEYLFFSQYQFHKHKIAYHRATMQAYTQYLKSAGLQVNSIAATTPEHDIRILLPQLIAAGITHLHCYGVTDNYLQRRLTASNITIKWYDSPTFLNKEADLGQFFNDKSSFMFQTSFYIQQRKNLGILLDDDGKPSGGKWSFDADNRKKYPRGKTPPPQPRPIVKNYWDEAVTYVEANFPNNPGRLDNQLYPIDHASSRVWLETFFKERFLEFGTYEDAIVADQVFLHHSVITPMLNIGLLTPSYVVNQALAFADKHSIPMNSLEGFIRQIIGWREFIRGIYGSIGSIERTKNYWGFNRKIPASFYDGTTGIKPVDDAIHKVLDKAYLHHIERLMILGNFMLLCEFDPDEVYRWFMELFIDAYDWVMVPNVYGMSQFADGGMMATKPYISGSNYIFKMSNYKKGEEWQPIWDGLFWSFMDKQRDFFLKNPRLGMLVRMYDKMPDDKKALHIANAEQYLKSLE